MALDLPDDCWEVIFSFLNPLFNQHLPITYVSKRFLAISNKSRTRLHFAYAPRVRLPFAAPPVLYARFPNITHLMLTRPDPQIGRFIRQLAASSLRLQTFNCSYQPNFPRNAMQILAQSMKKTLRALACWDIRHMTEGDIFLIADSFTYLHKLDLKNYRREQAKKFITDEAVLAISTKIVSLASLSLKFVQTDYFNHLSLDYLASHCNSLSELEVFLPKNNAIELHCFSSFKYLKTLKLSHVNISDSGLIHLAQAGNLKSLSDLGFYSVINTTVNGSAMCYFLKSCHSLTTLTFNNFNFSPDTMEIDFVASIAKSIKVIKISLCSNIPKNLLFNLLKSCPKLEEVYLYNFESEIDEESFNLPVHSCMRSLTLSTTNFSDKVLMLICRTCPRLKLFQIRGNSIFTLQGIKAIFRGHLSNFNCLRIHNFEEYHIKEYELLEKNNPRPEDLWYNVMDGEEDPNGEEFMKDLLIANRTDSEGSEEEDGDEEVRDNIENINKDDEKGSGEDYRRIRGRGG